MTTFTKPMAVKAGRLEIIDHQNKRKAKLKFRGEFRFQLGMIALMVVALGAIVIKFSEVMV